MSWIKCFTHIYLIKWRYYFSISLLWVLTSQTLLNTFYRTVEICSHAFFEISQNIGTLQLFISVTMKILRRIFILSDILVSFDVNYQNWAVNVASKWKQWISSFCNGTCSDAFWASKISKLLEKAMKSQIFWTTHVHVY